jgi:ribonuclease HII
MRIKEIEAVLKQTPINQIQDKLNLFLEDERAGVQKLLNTYAKKKEIYEKEVTEWHLKQEFDLFFAPHDRYLGVDEVGRGPLAGPVVAAAVILPAQCDLVGLKDSKQLSEEKREALFSKIHEVALSVGIGIVEADTIDEINILQATFRAMKEAIGHINKPFDVIGVDGDKTIPGVKVSQEAIIKGDNKSAAIAAASVIAKVTRDRMMKEYAKTYGCYEWEKNKGYGSQSHYEGIRTYGITPLHRKTFLKNEGIV